MILASIRVFYFLKICTSLLGLNGDEYLDTRPSFNQDELLHICQFLLGNTQQCQSNSVHEMPAAWPAPVPMIATPEAMSFAPTEVSR
jgi:hypothetical protein